MATQRQMRAGEESIAAIATGASYDEHAARFGRIRQHRLGNLRAGLGGLFHQGIGFFLTR